MDNPITNPATEKQIALLKKLGRSSEITPDLTKARAWQMIRYSMTHKFKDHPGKLREKNTWGQTKIKKKLLERFKAAVEGIEDKEH